MKFESESVNVEIPLEGLELDLGGWDHDRVILRHPDLADWVFYCHDKRLLKERAITQRNELRHQIEAFHRQRDAKKRLLISAVFLILFILAAGLVYLSTGALTRRIVDSIPVSVEKQIGDSAYQDIKEQGKLVENPAVLARLNDLTSRLLKAQPNSRYSYTVYLIDNQSPNAYAVPGGKLFVTTGMLKLTSDPEELAGVMSHEIAHVTQRHGLRQLVSSAGPLVILQAVFGADSGMVGILTKGSAVLLHQRFSRDYEREADELGWQNLVAANINPRGMIRFMEKIDRMEGKNRGLPGELSILSTHPPTQERVDRLQTLWRKTSKQNGYLNFKTQPLWNNSDQPPPPGIIRRP